ncbi:MAG: four-carbon acid sugar kinase family protein [Cyanobacteriota bacterium]
MAASSPLVKVIVFDDDPTGSQTVHGCPLLLRWDRASLRRALQHPSPLLFLLTNTRALTPEVAAQRVQALAVAMQQALQDLDLKHWLQVSRGDSTLRGHFPLEVEAIASVLGPFDALLLAPAFLPGGRTTVAGMHRLHGEPVHCSEFARDGLFAYSSSFLPEWVAEKSGGRIPAEQVARLELAELEGPPEVLLERLAGFEGGVCVAVDAERPQHLQALGAAVRELTAPEAGERWGRPRRFLFQSAASLLNGLVPLPPQPLEAAGLAGLRRRDSQGRLLPGLVLVGSHVPLADRQLAVLLPESCCTAIEIPVPEVLQALRAHAEPDAAADIPVDGAALASLEHRLGRALAAALEAGCTPVLFTSRGELVCASAVERRRLGLHLAALMARLAASLAPRLGYLISKGGITSHTLLADGLDLEVVELQGQLLAGLSLVLTPADARVPLLPVVTFPGNLGDDGSLRQVWRLLDQGV